MNRTQVALRILSSRVGLVFSAIVFVFACGAAWAQTRDGLLSRKRDIETSLKVLQQGDSHGVLAGWFDEGGKFKPVPTEESREFPYPSWGDRVYIPISPQKYADELAIQVLTGDLDPNLAQRRARATALRTRLYAKEIREGIELLKAQLQRDLADVNAELAEADRGNAQIAFLRPGSGVLKSEQGVPLGQFEIWSTFAGQPRDREIRIRFESQVSYAGPLESFDTIDQQAVYKVEGKLGLSRQRGHITVNRRTNTVSITMKEVFVPQGNTWDTIPRANWTTETYKLAD